MGRSSAAQAAKNRIEIVAAASRLFRERGVEGVAISDVMAAAGMTVGGFYKHFASKDALVREACARSFEQAMQGWRSVKGKEAGNASSTQALVRHYFRARPADQRCPMLAYAPGMAGESTSPVTRETYVHGIETLFDVFAQKGDETDGGQLQPDFEGDAAILFAAMVGAQLLVQATHGSAWSQSLLRAVAERSGAMDDVRRPSGAVTSGANPSPAARLPEPE